MACPTCLNASTTVATERREKRQKGNDIGMVDDIVAVPGGQQVHAMLVQLEAAKMTKKTEQDLVLKALAEKDPDTIVTLSATVIELEADTRADVEESIKFAIRMCQDQSSRTYLHCTRVAEMVDCFENMLESIKVVAHDRRRPSLRKHPAREIASRRRGLGSRALQGSPYRHRRSNTRRSSRDDRIHDEGTNSTMKPKMKSSTSKRWPKPVGKT